MRIAVSGKSGCGNTTVSKMLAASLNLSFINYTFRSMAEELGLDLRDVLAMAEGDDSWDKRLDERQIELSKRGDCVVGSRLAAWLIPDASLRVFLRARSETRADRIQRREGGSLAEIVAFTEMRDRNDHERYKRIYGIDNDDLSSIDLVIDVDDLSPESIVALIAERARG
jgi:CMP/dCMP kinase